MLKVVLVVILILLILMVFYLETKFLKFNIVKKIKNKYVMYLVTLIPFILLLIIFGYVNAIAIIFTLFMFFVLYELLFFIIKKFSNKEHKLYLAGIFAIVTTVIYLSIGAYLAFHVFETKYELHTDKDIKENIRILQISDTHMGTTFDSNKFSKYVDKMNKTNPDLVVITGDFVDDNTSKTDMIKSIEALSKFNPKYGTYFVYGNHDEGYFDKRDFSKTDLINELVKNDVIILEDQVMFIEDSFYLIGRKDKRDVRLGIDELTEYLDKEKYMIVLNHQPNDYKNESESKVDLVLSGHSHGGQLFPLGYIGVLFKANDAFKGLTTIDNTNFIVNTGMSDWELLFKTGTKSEYVIIDIVKNDKDE